MEIDDKLLKKTDLLEIYTLPNTKILLMDWHYFEGLSTKIFRDAISEFAELCMEHGPKKAVIDATELDPKSPAVNWLRGDNANEEQAYGDWWLSRIAPKYRQANIDVLAVATGDPNAPGEIDAYGPNLGFKVAYLNDLDDAMNWPL